MRHDLYEHYSSLSEKAEGIVVLRQRNIYELFDHPASSRHNENSCDSSGVLLTPWASLHYP